MECHYLQVHIPSIMSIFTCIYIIAIKVVIKSHRIKFPDAIEILRIIIL